MTPLSSFIKAVRQHRGITQGALAEAVGVKQSFVSDVENGRKKPEPGSFERWAAALDAPLELVERAYSHTIEMEEGRYRVIVDFHNAKEYDAVNYYVENHGWESTAEFLRKMALDVVNGLRPLLPRKKR